MQQLAGLSSATEKKQLILNDKYVTTALNHRGT